MARGSKPTLDRRPEDWFAPARPVGVPTTGDVDDTVNAALAGRSINTTAPLTGGGNLSADRTFAITPASGAGAGSMSAADKTKLDAISGTNTGDQTSIVGITGTKAQFDTACTDGNFLYVGDVSAYTDEEAQDAVGSILTDTGLAVVTYSDATPSIDVNVPAAVGSDFRTGSDATKALTSDAIWDAAAYVTLNDSGGNIAVDLSSGINFVMTMDGDYTLSAPSNGKPGQTGCIVLTQDGTGTQTLAYNSVWKFAGGTDPVLSTAASTVDILFYQVLANGTDVFANLVKGVA